MLTDTHIIEALNAGTWSATRDGQPVKADDLTIGPNSVNLTLADEIVEVLPGSVGFGDLRYIDLHDRSSFWVKSNLCDQDGMILKPGRLYLAAVREAFDCSAPLEIEQRVRVRGVGSPLGQVETYFFPEIDGRSTCGRVGLSVHATAGRGDYGFSGCFTLELTVAIPLRVREGDEIAQIYFCPLSGRPANPYTSVYADQGASPRIARLGKERFQR